MVLASYQFILADDVQIPSPCTLGWQSIISAVRHMNSLICLFILPSNSITFKFQWFFSLRRKQTHQRARGTLLWQQQLAAIDEFPWHHFAKPVFGFRENWPSCFYVCWNWNRKACFSGARDWQTTLVSLHTTFLRFFFFLSWESWQHIWILPRGLKLHFLLAYKTKQDKEVICSSSHIFLSLLFSSICENNSKKSNCAFFLF